VLKMTKSSLRANLCQNIAIAGVASPAGLGDALQCYVSVKLLNDLLPEANKTFLCPNLQEEISVFKNLKLNARSISVGLTEAGLLRYLLHSCAIDQLTQEKYMSTRNRNAGAETRTINKLVSETIGIISKHETSIYKPGKKHWASYIFSKYIGSSISRALFSFSAGIFGGHTICCNPYYFIVQYETLRCAVKGPMITSPISISKLELEHCRDKTLLKSMKQSLHKFDFIYVRGPHSLEFLRDQLNISDDRVAMALDSGFGARLIHSCTHETSEKQALKVIIIPRKESFSTRNKWNMYKQYLDALVGLVLWLFRSFDVEVYFASQVVDHSNLSGIERARAIDDVVRLLEKRAHRNNRCLKLRVVEPNNIVDAYSLYSSADLVVSSYMHGGVMALSAGVPTVFISPLQDVKVLDNLSFLHLDRNHFLIDMFDPYALRAENLIDVVRDVIDNLQSDRRTIELAVKKAMPTIELPIRKLARLLQ
jgi:hypothetical protein